MPSLALACRLSAVSMALRRASSPPQFLPSSLFGPADQGYWYDNQDLLNYTGELGPDISNPISNGPFDVSVNAGIATCTKVGTAEGGGLNLGVLPSNAYFRVRFKYRVLTVGHPVAVTHAAEFSQPLPTDGSVYQYDRTALGSNYLYIRSMGTGACQFEVFDYSVSEVLSISNCTMFQDTAGTVPVTDVEQPVGKQLDKSGKGNHRIAPGPTTRRPILRARYNLLTYSEDFSNPAWIKSNISVTDQGGGVFRVQYTQGTLGILYQTKSVPAGNIKLSFDIKTNPGSPNSNVSIMAAGVRAAAITTTHEWQRVEYVGLNNGSGDIGIISASDLSAADVLVRFPDLRFETDANLPQYQRIAAATDYDTVGFPLYLDTDGADDFMRTAATVDFSGSDKVTLVQGLHKRNDAPAIFNELSTHVGSNSGTFYTVTGLDGAPSASYSSNARGTAAASWLAVGRFTTGQYPAPDTAIISTMHDIAGDLSRIWRNGVVGIDGTADKGAGNFSNDYVYFYARGGSTSRFNGRDYGQFAISRLLSDEDRAKVQNVFNAAMGGIY